MINIDQRFNCDDHSNLYAPITNCTAFPIDQNLGHIRTTPRFVPRRMAGTICGRPVPADTSPSFSLL